MNDYVVTTRDEDGAYFYVCADCYEISGTISKYVYFYYHEKIVCMIPLHSVFEIQRIFNDSLINEYQDK